jgi:hypothetical protein
MNDLNVIYATLALREWETEECVLIVKGYIYANRGKVWPPTERLDEKGIALQQYSKGTTTVQTIFSFAERANEWKERLRAILFINSVYMCSFAL